MDTLTKPKRIRKNKPIVKLQGAWEIDKLLRLGYQPGDRVRVSIPRRKGRRTIFGGRLVRYDPKCGCCSPYLYIATNHEIGGKRKTWGGY
jgi:hypothetical protein